MNLAAVWLLSLASVVCAVACKSKSEGAASASASASPSAHAFVHPPIPKRKVDYEAEAQAIERAHRQNDPAPAASAPKVDWKKSCQVNRECKEKQRPIGECAAARPKFTWSDLQHAAETMLGKQVEVMGNIGLTPAGAIKGGACAPGDCCHSLRFAMVVDGSPSAALLPGYTCAGDDSKLCCSVENEGQEVVAVGKLEKAPAGSAAKWQLKDAELCIPPRLPEATSPMMGGGM